MDKQNQSKVASAAIQSDSGDGSRVLDVPASTFYRISYLYFGPVENTVKLSFILPLRFTFLVLPTMYLQTARVYIMPTFLPRNRMDLGILGSPIYTGDPCLIDYTWTAEWELVSKHAKDEEMWKETH